MESKSATDDLSPGTLYVVATPIGNLEDMTFRALRVLKGVDLVAAEDTRHSRKLFNHYGIGTPLTSYYRHNEAMKGEQIIAELRQGKRVALISDAGTPAISDPGFHLVKRCRDEGIRVEAVPGPSAVIAALSISGLETDRFAFEGFLPSKMSARRELLSTLKGETRTVVFYEAPHRLEVTLRDLVDVLGGAREVAVARELTKVHEELFRGTAQEASIYFGKDRIRGEIVLMVAPVSGERTEETVADALKRWRDGTDLPMRVIVKEVAKEFGLSGSEVYRESLKLKNQREI